jgi:hypothetical protein
LSNATHRHRGAHLFERVFREHCAVSLHETRAILAGLDAGAYERLRRYVAAIAKGSGSAGDGRGCLIAKTTAEFSGSDALRDQARASYDELTKMLTACIERRAAERRHRIHRQRSKARRVAVRNVARARSAR